jgi:hypothetical protein
MIESGTYPAHYEGGKMEEMSNCVRACVRMLVGVPDFLHR